MVLSLSCLGHFCAHASELSSEIYSFGGTGKKPLDPARSPATTLAALRHELGEGTLRDAVAICTARQRLEERGEIDAFRARYPGLRRYLPAFFTLPFQGEPGSEAVLKGLDVVRQLDAGTQKALSWLAPT